MRKFDAPAQNHVRRVASALLPIFLQWALFTSNASCLSVDGVALLTFKHTLTSDPYNALANWNATDSTPCAWSGITCNSSFAHEDNNTTRVIGLELIGKRLGGVISPALGALSSLLILKLQGNNFNGSLPLELFNASSLQTLLLGGNHITGALPPQIGRLNTLEFLDVSSNAMLGMIPDSLTKCTQLKSLVLARNLFSGPLPKGLARNLTALEQLDLSSNRFSGSIPADFGKLSALQGTLNLSFNHLSGGIPLSLGDLPYTVSLDLSHNNLTGRIPQDGSLSEQGPGPFLYNPGLCGFPLSNVCPVTPFLSPLPSLPTEASSQSTLYPQSGEANSSNTTKKPSLSPRAIVAITLGDAAGVSLMASLFVYLYWKTRGCKEMDYSPSACVGKDFMTCISKTSRCTRRHRSSEDSEASLPGSEKGQEQGELVALDKEFSFDIDELLRASAYVLGQSGIGIVYKVVLGNGTPVAVRRIGEEGSQKRKDFEAEVHAIGKLRHSNVVRLLAYYWADDEKLLVYEFISHGTLASALQGHSQPPLRTLTWEERMRIARGIARGLAYLHECSPRKYVHGDIKTTKILLDAGMHPYIADFGLARLALIAGVDEMMGGSARIYRTSERSGPEMGASERHVRSMYRAPEALLNAKPAQKWDVYGFGVVAMELIGGRARALQMATGGMDFVGSMRKAAEEGTVEGVLDATIAATAHVPSVASLLSLAVACTHSSPDHRPKMRSVAECLDKLILQTLC